LDAKRNVPSDISVCLFRAPPGLIVVSVPERRCGALVVVVAIIITIERVIMISPIVKVIVNWVTSIIEAVTRVKVIKSTPVVTRVEVIKSTLVLKID
jgi:hypothetical protein